MIRAPLFAILALVPGALSGQDNTAELLDRAAKYHADLDVERELVLLRQVISPSSPFVLYPQQYTVPSSRHAFRTSAQESV